MKISAFRHSRAGFTLAELILAMAIMMIMGAMTILVYFNVSENSRRLQLSREISETARQITERIAQEVRANGISLNHVNQFETTTQKEFWKEQFLTEYSDKWGEILALQPESNQTGQIEAKKFLVYGKKNGNNLTNCTDQDKNDIKTHCGLYFVNKNDTNPEYYNLVDAFREEDKKRVKITDLKFYISGGDNEANKVTLKMTLELMARDGVPPSLVRASKMEVQTTFSERPYKIQ